MGTLNRLQTALVLLEQEGSALSALTRSLVEPARPCSKDPRPRASGQCCRAAKPRAGDLLQKPHRERRTREPLLFIGRLEEGHAPFPTALIFDWLLGSG